MGGAKGYLLPLALAAALVAGCGGGSATNSTQSGTTVDWSMYPKGPTREFIIPGGDNVVQTYGHEATPAEREQATATIAAWMRARAARDWGRDCSYLARLVAKELAEEAHRVSTGKVKNCEEALAFFKQSASGDYVNTFGSGPVVSMRVKEGHGYAQYHGADGKDWILPVYREKNGEWKVAIAAPIDRTR